MQFVLEGLLGSQRWVGLDQKLFFDADPKCWCIGTSKVFVVAMAEK